ncbi:MAG: ABC transporter permease, partial [Pseudohongiella sp.]|nr:ABC transporter permease [Pseudohongiella sp.]
MADIKYFWRQIQADKLFTVMTLAGLTVAITCSLIIFTYVSYHYSFNQFHENSDRIYRFLTIDTSQPDVYPAGMTTNALIPAIRNEIPEVELATRFQFSLSITVRVNDRVHYLDQALLAEPEFFQMFNFPLIAGVSGEALTEPNTAVLSQSFAMQLFGDQDAVGKVINVFNSRDMRVVGVIEDMPANSHIQADLIMAMLPDPAWPVEMAARYESWRVIDMQSYVRLYPDSDPLVVEQKVLALIEEREESGYIAAVMQSLQDIHLHSQQVQSEVNAGKEDARQMYVLIGIAILLMTIAVCNFVNLSTAKGVTRAKEVGIRKTVGALR